MSKSRERVGWLPSNHAVTATALLALSFSWAFQQNPTFRSVMDGLMHSFSSRIDAARAPREKAGIVRQVTSATPIDNAAAVDARIIQGFVEMYAEEDALNRALAANPVHSSDPFATLPRSVSARYENVVGSDGVSRRRVVGEFRLPARPRRVDAVAAEAVTDRSE